MIALIEAMECEMRGAAAAMTHATVMALHERFAVPFPVLARLTGAGLIGRANVTIEDHGGRWSPGGPDWRLIMPVTDWSDMVDLVAISSGDVHEWALRSEAGWCLGFDAYYRVIVEETRVLRIHSCPLDWLRALEPLPLEGKGWLRSAGICVVDWSQGIRELRSLGEGVQLVVDPGTKERMQGLLRFGGLPRVVERGADSGGRMAA